MQNSDQLWQLQLENRRKTDIIESLEAKVSQVTAELRQSQDECKLISKRKDLHDADRNMLLQKIEELNKVKSQSLSEQLKYQFEAEQVKSRSVPDVVHATA